MAATRIPIARYLKPRVPERPKFNNWSFGSNGNQASGFIKNAYFNGLGRQVNQLQRVTIKFCKFGGVARGVREFIERDIVDFSRKYPGVVVYLKPRRKAAPVVVTEYLNGNEHWMTLKNMSREEVGGWLEHHVTRSGEGIKRYRKPSHSDWPTIQGFWTPFMNMPTDLNISTFPNEERSQFKLPLPSATEQLLKLEEENKLKSMILSEHPSNSDQKH
jgi:large subunit ribosomal protein L43